MKGFPTDLRADEGLEVLQENLANDGLDLGELAGEVSEGMDIPELQAKNLAGRCDQVQSTFFNWILKREEKIIHF